jgi:DNA-directed RNA polymerase delta subunit
MSKNNLTTLTEGLIKELSSRDQTIIKKRFGLFDKKPMTFNAIGLEFKVTRERIRQIQEECLKDIREKKMPTMYKDFINASKKILKNNGDVLEDVAFMNSLKDEYGKDTQSGVINFLLSLNENFYFFSGNNFFKPFWCFANINLNEIKKLAESIESILKKNQAPMTLKEIEKSMSAKVNSKYISNVMHIYKKIGANPFGQFGLISWSIINPLNARDKAYFLMKYYLKKPVHFKALTSHLKENEALNVNQMVDKKKKEVSVQTVHNELIKDPRFVLVGHGNYALAEWGYNPGVIKDIIVQILQTSNHPLSENDIISKVKEQRMAKDNTIKFNLRNSNQFEKNSDGKYQLKATPGISNDIQILSA